MFAIQINIYVLIITFLKKRGAKNITKPCKLPNKIISCKLPSKTTKTIPPANLQYFVSVFTFYEENSYHFTSWLFFLSDATLHGLS